MTLLVLIVIAAIFSAGSRELSEETESSLISMFVSTPVWHCGGICNDNISRKPETPAGVDPSHTGITEEA